MKPLNDMRILKQLHCHLQFLNVNDKHAARYLQEEVVIYDPGFIYMRVEWTFKKTANTSKCRFDCKMIVVDLKNRLISFWSSGAAAAQNSCMPKINRIIEGDNMLKRDFCDLVSSRGKIRNDTLLSAAEEMESSFWQHGSRITRPKTFF